MLIKVTGQLLDNLFFSKLNREKDLSANIVPQPHPTIHTILKIQTLINRGGSSFPLFHSP